VAADTVDQAVTQARAWVAELEDLVDMAAPLDLELMPPAGGNEFSADLMKKSPTRPAIGVQGIILDAMCDERITTSQAIELLAKVNRRIQKEKEAANHGR
jgi:predicted RNA-binding protein Jag